MGGLLLTGKKLGTYQRTNFIEVRRRLNVVVENIAELKGWEVDDTRVYLNGLYNRDCRCGGTRMWNQNEFEWFCPYCNDGRRDD